MGGKSSSSTQANQTQTSTTQDNRIVGESGSVAFAGSSGNTVTSTDNSQSVVNYNTLDGGAVGDSYDFAANISKGAASLSAASVGAMADTTKNALDAVADAYSGSMAGTIKISSDAMGRVQDMAETSNASVAKAWQNAVGAIADNSKMSVSAISTANCDALKAVQTANGGVIDALSDAWQESKAGEQKLVSYAVIAALGMVAFRAVGSR
jgi:predicted transcriptional regulator